MLNILPLLEQMYRRYITHQQLLQEEHQNINAVEAA